MPVTPFTMEDVVNGVLLELRYAPGRDVQIHLQDSIMQDASMLYRMLMQKYIWRDYYYMTSFMTDSSGVPIQDLSAVMSKFSDILYVYREKDERPLPFAAALVNPQAL